MKTLLLTGLLFLSTFSYGQKSETIKLWNKNMPNSNEIKVPEKVAKDSNTYNVSSPELIVYKAKRPNGLAIVECPGGGYSFVSMNNEGYSMADYFTEQGITFVILKYRLPNGHYEVPLSDAKQAIKIVRSHAKDWGINKVGIMGASAGGHLATTLATHYTKETRPDFQVLFYPVVTMDKSYTHMGTHDNLIGNNASNELETKYSNELSVTKDTPMAFIMHCQDDNCVPVKNSINYFNALTANGVSASLHIYPKGGHGWGYRDTFKYKSQWKNELKKWLKEVAKN